MKNRVLAALAVAIGVSIGVAATAASRPLWSYHNGNTLLSHTVDYRNGFTIGVVDGYLRAHSRLARRGEGPEWLDRCLAAGWTVHRTSRVAAEYLDKAVMEMKNPGAHIILDGLKKACAQEK